MTSGDFPTVLVTGCSGLIGSRVCARLSQRYHVVGLDVKPPENTDGHFSWIECDLTNDIGVQEVLKIIAETRGPRLASVIHLAAYYDFSGEPSNLYEDLTVQGTWRLLRGLNHFAKVEQFVFSSSLLVMRPCEPGHKLVETSPMQAEWEYPLSKLDAEEVIRSEHGLISAVILRVAGVYDEDGHSLPITQNIRRIAERKMESYFYPGDAERGQSFVHLDDLMTCFEQTVEKRGELGPWETFLIAEDECLSYEALQDLIGKLVHGEQDWPTLRIPKVVAKAGAWIQEKLAPTKEEPFIKPWMIDLADAHYPVDNSYARLKLDWVPQHKLSKTLPERSDDSSRIRESGMKRTN
jgi:nucleoside-diphosphate-sugar epimerase